MDLFDAVRRYSARHHLFAPGDALVVGVSGGPDSVALLDLLRRLAESWDLRLHVAHLHHGIRGADADADAAFVAALAERWGLPYTVGHADLPEIARQEQLALEEACRRVRYAFLARVAEQVGARTIAVAHHADDQAETVLMHLLRGTGPAGLRGMLPATPLVDYVLPGEARGTEKILVRPLLATPRVEIEAYCAERNLEFRLDRSNLDTTFFRNHLRHEVLPYLRQTSPRITERLCHLAEVVRADYEVLADGIEEAWEALLVAADPQALVFDLDGWRAQPLAVQRALVRRAVHTLRCTLRDVDFVHIEDAVRCVQEGATGTQATLPRGLMVVVGYTTVTIGDAAALPLPSDRPWLAPGSNIPLTVPGETPLPGGWTLVAESLDRWEMSEVIGNTDPFTAWVDASRLGASPVLRTRRRGDRFQPQGLEGAEVKVSDFLVNVKFPATWRDALPLLESEGHLLWLVGLRLSEEALVQAATASVIRFKVRPSGSGHQGALNAG